jgi:hypothetical protein
MSLSTSVAELKAQGVIEAAQDPNSSVTADDAQQKIVIESKKAGVAAFTFDPRASPEEKAAQARAVSTCVDGLAGITLIRTSLQQVPEGFHHEHKSKGVAIPTDIDDGKPGAYDLPPPSTSGAIAAPPAKDKNGAPLTNGANGHIEKEDSERWIERTGWAPRFGNGASNESIEGESLAEHQTWLEGKLEDKFYGGRLASNYQRANIYEL